MPLIALPPYSWQATSTRKEDIEIGQFSTRGALASYFLDLCRAVSTRNTPSVIEFYRFPSRFLSTRRVVAPGSFVAFQQLRTSDPVAKAEISFDGSRFRIKRMLVETLSQVSQAGCSNVEVTYEFWLFFTWIFETKDIR